MIIYIIVLLYIPALYLVLIHSGMVNGVLWLLSPRHHGRFFWFFGGEVGVVRYIMVTNNIQQKLKYLQLHNNYMYYILY